MVLRTHSPSAADSNKLQVAESDADFIHNYFARVFTMDSGGLSNAYDSNVTDGDVLMSNVESANASDFCPDSVSENASVVVWRD